MATKMYNLSGVVQATPNGTHSGVDITIQNLSTDNIYIGTDQYVTSSYFGHKLEAGKSVAFSVGPNDSLFLFGDSPMGSLVATLILDLIKR